MYVYIYIYICMYVYIFDFFNSLSENQGWTLMQFNFTVGVRGSISNVDSGVQPHVNRPARAHFC